MPFTRDGSVSPDASAKASLVCTSLARQRPVPPPARRGREGKYFAFHGSVPEEIKRDGTENVLDSLNPEVLPPQGITDDDRHTRLSSGSAVLTAFQPPRTPLRPTRRPGWKGTLRWVAASRSSPPGCRHGRVAPGWTAWAQSTPGPSCLPGGPRHAARPDSGLSSSPERRVGRAGGTEEARAHFNGISRFVSTFIVLPSALLSSRLGLRDDFSAVPSAGLPVFHPLPLVCPAESPRSTEEGALLLAPKTSLRPPACLVEPRCPSLTPATLCCLPAVIPRLTTRPASELLFVLFPLLVM